MTHDKPLTKQERQTILELLTEIEQVIYDSCSKYDKGVVFDALCRCVIKSATSQYDGYEDFLESFEKYTELRWGIKDDL